MVEVPSEKHGQLIGPRGETKRSLEQQFKVSIEIPKKGSDRTDITITGVGEDVEKMKDHLVALAEQKRQGGSVDVPQHLHHVISANGKLFWRLKNDYDVTVDHAGVKPPPRQPESTPPRPPAPGHGLPLITDGDGVEAHSWVLVAAEGAQGKAGPTIPWKLSGPSSEKVATAKQQVERAIETACRPSATGYLTLSDPRFHRFVIGPGGRNINSIREQTGCNIQVPNARSAAASSSPTGATTKAAAGGVGGGSSHSEAIEIVGSEDNCLKAKDLVLEFVKNGAARG